MYRNQGPEYYGDLDETDEALVAEEEELARQGGLETVFQGPRDETDST